MSTTVNHVSSRCGAGKSYRTIQALYDHLAKHPQETVVFASKTNKLTKANHENFCTASESAPTPAISFERIDSATIPSSTTVLTALHDRLDQRQPGVIFVSHNILNTVNPLKLRDVWLIIDEIPAELVRHLRVTYEHQGHDPHWERYIATRPSQHKSFSVASLEPSESTLDLGRLIENIRQGVDTSVTRDVASLLEFLLEGYEVAYTYDYRTKGRTMRAYLATRWLQLQKLVTHTKNLAILSAQIDDTLLAFVLKQVIHTSITPSAITPDLTLDAVHDKPTAIYPLLEGKQWSKNFKTQNAFDALLFDGSPVTSEQTVASYFQELAHQIIDRAPSLLILNKYDTIHEIWNDTPIKDISSSSHGMNYYTDYDHAVFLSANRPNPNEVNALGLFALDHGATREEIMETVLIERCYESAYQSVARTSVRNEGINEDVIHKFVVPNDAYAEYIATWFSPGMATIDTSYRHQLRPSPKYQEKHEASFDRIVKIREDLRDKKGKRKDLIVLYGLDERQYSRDVERYRPRLEALGLVKPKR